MEMVVTQDETQVRGGFLFGISTTNPNELEGETRDLALRSIMAWPNSKVVDCYGKIWRVDQKGDCQREDQHPDEGLPGNSKQN